MDQTKIDLKNFASISKEVQAYIRSQSWFKSYGIEHLKLALRFILFFIGYFLFAQEQIVLTVLGMMIMGYAYVGICITGIHEASHKALAKRSWINKLWAIFYTDFWTSKSHLWWKYRHIDTHHPHPNDPVKEPKPFYFPWINRYVYFFLIPYAVVPWLFISSIVFLRKQPLQLLQFMLFAIAGFWFQSFLFTSLGYSLGIAILLVWLMRSLYAPIFMHLAVFNHLGLENPQPAKPWISQQTVTTRNIKPNWFLSGIGGNAFLDGHLEHHLFPRISNHMISKVRPMITKNLQEQGYLYMEEGYVSCLKHCLVHYDNLFKDQPEALW